MRRTLPAVLAVILVAGVALAANVDNAKRFFKGGFEVVAGDGTLASGTDLVLANGLVRHTAQALSVADNVMDGGTHTATATLTVTSGYVECTCSDGDGCDITMSESGATEGDKVSIVNVGTNTCAFADSAGVSELAGAFSAGAADAITLIYNGSAWVELDRSNN